MRSITLYKFDFDPLDAGCDDQTEAWIRVQRYGHTHFETLDTAIQYAKRAILGAIEAECRDIHRRLIYDGEEREYNHKAATWSVQSYPDTLVEYSVPYARRTVDIDWDTRMVKVGDWQQNDYPDVRRVSIAVVRLTVLEASDSET